VSDAGFRRLWSDLQAAGEAERQREAADGLPLFDQPHTRARLTDPGTSHAAAAGSREQARAQRAAILAALRQYGPLTADELDARLHWRDTTAGRRMRELWQAGAVETTGEERPTRSGRAAEVWQLREARAA
jgi:hypothetical protein